MLQASGFVPYGPDHRGVLLGTALATVGLLIVGPRLRTTDDRWARRGVALLLLGNEAVAWLIAASQGVVRVPLQLCDLALFLSVWALLSLKRFPAEVAYFWGLAGSLQAVVTPDLQEPFPTYWWVKFFVGHCGIVLGVIYLAVTGRVQPTLRSIWRVWVLTLLYAAGVGFVNWRFGANFGYLAHKPAHPSLLDPFGPWPFYIVGMAVVALLSFYLYYAPFAVARWLSRRRPVSGGRS